MNTTANKINTGVNSTMNANEINARRYFINGKEVTANRYAAMKRLNAYIGRKQAEAFSRGDMENIATRAAWFTYEAAADAEYGIARYIEDCRRFGYLKEETATETTAPEFSELSHTATSAICPLDFDTTFDAYNYAMAHRLDESPLAVAIPTDAHGTDYGRSLALNGVKLFAVWSDELEETANGYVYTTEAGAREAMAQVEDNDKEAGVYEPNYWKVSDMTKYFA